MLKYLNSLDDVRQGFSRPTAPGRMPSEVTNAASDLDDLSQGKLICGKHGSSRLHGLKLLVFMQPPGTSFYCP